MHRRGTLIFGLALVSLSTAGLSADFKVDQLNKTFSQSSLTVKVGDTVFFLNGDDVTHNITVVDKDDNGDDKGLQKPGETISHKFTVAGDYNVHCQIHPRMKMTIKAQ